jgi:CheY-like chemotaxis protein
MARKEESATAPTRSREHRPPEPEQARPRASVLLVDDQPARLLTYEAILSGVGVECVRALSGLEALEKLLAREFAAILLDVEMPGMDGFEVARMIRQHPRMERTPIIFVTGVHISQLDQLKGYEVGAIDYLSVPVVPEILRSKVALLVELHLRRDELKDLNRSLEDTRERLQSQYSTLLAERAGLLRAAFEHPDAFTAILQAQRNSAGIVTDWVYVDANSNTVAGLGLPREAIVGKRLRDVISMERAGSVLARCNEALATRKPVRYENRFAERDLLITIFPAGHETVVSSGMDITALRRAQSAVRANERRNQADRSRSLEAGCETHLTKAVDPGTLRMLFTDQR